MKGKKILIADDVNHIHEQLSRVLFTHGCAIFHAFNGREAVELIKAVKPDLVLLDTIMPGEDGFDICQELKNDPDTKDVLVLLLTADNRPHNKYLCLDAGADDYIAKPFSPDHVADRARELLAEG